VGIIGRDCMATYFYLLVTIVTLLMAVRSCVRMLTARHVTRTEQWLQLVVTVAVLAWFVV
jgi:hypothetical protein